MAESSENAAAAPAPAPPAALAPTTVPSLAAKTSPPTSSGIPPRYDLDAKWDAFLDLSIRHVAYSSLVGAFWASSSSSSKVALPAPYYTYVVRDRLP
ncbi:hypothetical protein D1007_30962 [Hordeum vulgare]|nr:hypothetical protein D1007_30962 [Hordeum vulgare]